MVGAETSPVIGLNYLIPVGQIWWRSEVMPFFTFFCDFPTNFIRQIFMTPVENELIASELFPYSLILNPLNTF